MCCVLVDLLKAYLVACLHGTRGKETESPGNYLGLRML